MTGRRISIIFAGVILAAVVGWLVGTQLQDALSRRYDVAVAVVGEGLEVSSPPPPAPSEGTSASVSPGSSPTGSPEPDETQRPSIAEQRCGSEPPGDDCRCRLRDREWTWICDLPD
jgi:hypothetical protein